MFLFLIRHGQPDYGKDCLTEDGRKQAKAVAERFAVSGLDKIYSSTMGRAMETAKYTAEKLNLPICGVDFAREDLAGAEFGVVRNGIPTWCFYDNKDLELFASPEISALGYKWYESPVFKDTKFESGVKRMEKAVGEFLKELGYERDEQTGIVTPKNLIYDRVALFAHGGFSMIFMSTILHIPYPMWCSRFFHFGFSAVTAIELPHKGEARMPRVFQHSNDSHLYKEDLLDTFDVRPF